MALTQTRRATLRERSLPLSMMLLMAVSVMGSGQVLQSQTSAADHVAGGSSSSSPENSVGDLQDDLDSCRVHRVTSLPGSHQFASDFIEAIASDPDPYAEDPDVIWGLTADLSGEVPPQGRAMYISRSTNGGATWTQVAKVGPRYFDAKIGEGLRNGFTVSPGGTYFVITTQRGAFQVFPQPGATETVVKAI